MYTYIWMQVLDERKRAGAGTLTGQHWYTLSAMRVANQALGRVIRHRHDYGSILLADERFGRPDMKQGISFWARSFLTVRESFGSLQADLEAFYQTNDKNLPKPALRSVPGASGVEGKSGAVFGKPAANASAAAPAATGGRKAFVPPKAGGRMPAKAGAAEHGGSALRTLENNVHIASARDVFGSGRPDTSHAMHSQQAPLSSQSAPCRQAMRRHTGTAAPLDSAALACGASQHTSAGCCNAASEAPVAAAPASNACAAPAAEAGREHSDPQGAGGSSNADFKAFLAELRGLLDKGAYKQACVRSFLAEAV